MDHKKDDKMDHLALATNAKVEKLLDKEGDNKPTKEVVKFSDFVVKINRKGKEQARVLMVTDKAVYNLLSDYGKCKRRIPLESILSITASSTSNEFVFHVPDEYDYRFKTAKKDIVINLLSKLYIELQKIKNPKKPLKMGVSYVQDADLKDETMTKAAARMLTIQDRLKRKEELLNSHKDSDDEDEEEKKDMVTQMIEDTEKVKLEDFDLLKVLGRGSFGKVMQVRKKDTGKVFAMKILKKRAIVARNQVEHTKAERKILQALQHPYLMRLRYAFQSKEKLYFVLDYYQGGELFFHLKQKRRFSEDIARLYVAEIALALGHLHGLGVIYRDLKPENILLDEDGHVCLTDFGLSKDVDPDEEAQTFCGTPEYLAPEIVSGVGHNKAVDWWSLGILLYELTVGIPPFYSQNVNQMYVKIQKGVLRFPPFLSEDCTNLIIALLQRDPKQRLGSENDIDDIKKADFFKSMDWDKLMKKQIESPYKPKVQSQGDTSNFDETFTKEAPVDSMINPGTLEKASSADADQFNSFTYMPKKSVSDE